MTMQEQIKKFQEQCAGLVHEMHEWFHGLGSHAQETFTPEQAFQAQMREQAKTFQDQMSFAKRAIQDGRKAQELLNDPFVQTLHLSLRQQFDRLAATTLTTAKSMEDITHARGWKEGATAFFVQLDTLVKLGKGAEEILVSLTKRGNT